MKLTTVGSLDCWTRSTSLKGVRFQTLKYPKIISFSQLYICWTQVHFFGGAKLGRVFVSIMDWERQPYPSWVTVEGSSTNLALLRDYSQFDNFNLEAFRETAISEQDGCTQDFDHICEFQSHSNEEHSSQLFDPSPGISQDNVQPMFGFGFDLGDQPCAPHPNSWVDGGLTLPLLNRQVPNLNCINSPCSGNNRLFNIAEIDSIQAADSIFTSRHFHPAKTHMEQTKPDLQVSQVFKNQGTLK